MPDALVLLLALGPLLLILLGAIVLGVQARVRKPALDRRPDTLAVGLATLGWTLVLVGLFALVAVVTHIFFLFAWLATGIVVLAIRSQYRRMEQRSLLWVLMAAAERGIPLEAAARDFAEERHDWIGQRASDLAEYLEAGLPLALALERSRLAAFPAILLAADLGGRTGNLGPALRQALSRNDATEMVLRSAAEKLFYVAFLAAFGLGIWGFLMIKVMPSFSKIFEDFGMEQTEVARLLVGASRVFFEWWPLVLPVAALVLLVLVNGMLYYTGVARRPLLGCGRLGRIAESAVIMRWLAAAVRRGRPMVEMVRLLAGYFPRRTVRRRLERTAKRLDQGADWSDALAQAGLIRRPEAAVFRAAERTGNLAWALEEMADSSLRRAAYRLRAAASVAFPTMIAVFGACVFMVALGVLGPLMKLIQGLT